MDETLQKQGTCISRGTEGSMCKGPEVGACPGCLRSGRETGVLKDSRHVRKVSKVIGTILGPCGQRLTLTFPLSVRESPWMVLSKEINKSPSGYRGRKGTRKDGKVSEEASAHPGKRCGWHGLVPEEMSEVIQICMPSEGEEK